MVAKEREVGAFMLSKMLGELCKGVIDLCHGRDRGGEHRAVDRQPLQIAR